MGQSCNFRHKEKPKKNQTKRGCCENDINETSINKITHFNKCINKLKRQLLYNKEYDKKCDIVTPIIDYRQIQQGIKDQYLFYLSQKRRAADIAKLQNQSLLENSKYAPGSKFSADQPSANLSRKGSLVQKRRFSFNAAKYFFRGQQKHEYFSQYTQEAPEDMGMAVSHSGAPESKPASKQFVFQSQDI